MTPEQRELLQDKLGIWRQQSEHGAVDWRDYNRRCAEALEAALAAAPEMFAALTLAEDVLSRFPYSSELWPNGTHPNTGITQIRAALAKARGDQ